MASTSRVLGRSELNREWSRLRPGRDHKGFAIHRLMIPHHFIPVIKFHLNAWDLLFADELDVATVILEAMLDFDHEAAYIPFWNHLVEICWPVFYGELFRLLSARFSRHGFGQAWLRGATAKLGSQEGSAKLKGLSTVVDWIIFTSNELKETQPNGGSRG